MHCVLDDAAADDAVAVVEDDALPGGDRAHGIVKTHAETIAVELPVARRAAIAGADLDAGVATLRIRRKQVHAGGDEAVCEKGVVCADADGVLDGIGGGDVRRIAESEAKSPALADGVAPGAVVFAEGVSVGVDETACARQLVRTKILEKSGIVVARDEADFLRFFFTRECARAFRAECPRENRTDP